MQYRFCQCFPLGAAGMLVQFALKQSVCSRSLFCFQKKDFIGEKKHKISSIAYQCLAIHSQPGDCFTVMGLDIGCPARVAILSLNMLSSAGSAETELFV